MGKLNFVFLLSSALGSDFKFINQRTVKIERLVATRVVSHQLSKSEVIMSINYYIKRIQHLGKDVRSCDINYNAFKMHDLVPYLYSLINYFLSVYNFSDVYERYLPELKLSRFCHLPFEEKIIPPVELPEIVVNCAYLVAGGSAEHQYVALLSSYHPIACDTFGQLRDKLQFLFPMRRVILKVIGS